MKATLCFMFVAPEENVATIRHGAAVIRGEMKASLLDGDSSNYDLDRGFTRHPIDENTGQGIVIKLATPCIINTFKMLLWDRDQRYTNSMLKNLGIFNPVKDFKYGVTSES